MKATIGCLSNYEIRAIAFSRDRAESSVGNWKMVVAGTSESKNWSAIGDTVALTKHATGALPEMAREY